MLIDEAQPEADATRVEHLVVPGEPAAVYEIVLRADFMRAWRESAAVKVPFALRSFAERLVSGTARPDAEPLVLRLADMPETGERYWWAVSPFVGVVMRSMLHVIERDARAAAAAGGSRQPAKAC